MKKICPQGHTFYKTSDCPVCPICEGKKSSDGVFSTLNAPARRALENAHIKTRKQLSKKTEKEVLALHGIGPSSMPVLKKILSEAGLSFRKE